MEFFLGRSSTRKSDYDTLMNAMINEEKNEKKIRRSKSTESLPLNFETTETVSFTKNFQERKTQKGLQGNDINKEDLKKIFLSIKQRIFRLKLNQFFKQEKFKKERKRLKQIMECIETEENYLKNLTYCCEEIIKKTEDKKNLKKEEIKVIFSNFQQIRTISSVLYEEMMKNYKTGVIRISESYLKVSHYFKCYKDYINNFDESRNMLQKCKKKLDFKKNNENDYQIEDYLILPITRIPRYRLLMENVIKLTRKENSEIENLKKSLKIIEDVATFVNNQRLDKKNSEVMNKLSKVLPNEKIFSVPFRKFIMRKTCSLICEKKKIQNKKFTLYIFNDILIFLNEKEKLFSKAPEFFLISFTFSKIRYDKSNETTSVDTISEGSLVTFSFTIPQDGEDFSESTDMTPEKIFELIKDNISNSKSLVTKNTSNKTAKSYLGSTPVESTSLVSNNSIKEDEKI